MLPRRCGGFLGRTSPRKKLKSRGITCFAWESSSGNERAGESSQASDKGQPARLPVISRYFNSRSPFDGKIPCVNVNSYPDAVDPSLVGTYSPLAKAGGGYVWDDVLEYRVWCHPERGTADEQEGSDYYHAFATSAEAAAFSESTQGAEEPL